MIFMVEQSLALAKNATKIIVQGAQVIIKRRNHPDFVVIGLFEVKSAERCMEEDESLRNLPNETAKTAVENVDESLNNDSGN